MKVYVVLIIYQDNGTIIKVFETGENAHKFVAQYCRKHWAGDRVPGDLPDDDKAVTERYYEQMREEEQTNFYEVTEYEVLP